MLVPEKRRHFSTTAYAGTGRRQSRYSVENGRSRIKFQVERPESEEHPTFKTLNISELLTQSLQCSCVGHLNFTTRIQIAGSVSTRSRININITKVITTSWLRFTSISTAQITEPSPLHLVKPPKWLPLRPFPTLPPSRTSKSSSILSACGQQWIILKNRQEP